MKRGVGISSRNGTSGESVDEGLWARIRATTHATSFAALSAHLDSRGLDVAGADNGAYSAIKTAARDFLKAEYRNEPPLVELIWSYWHEEGMLVRTMEAVCQRLQHRNVPGARDPLQALELSPLRPLSNLLWAYIEDEPHRVSVKRRAHEYEHHYGISLRRRFGGGLRAEAPRTSVLGAFHDLLRLCVVFYRDDDDTTVVSDGFPVLNGLRETHRLVEQRAHNRFGDLPETDREEKLIEMWLLSRPETREFLRGETAVPYPECWMDRVERMKALQGWQEPSVVHFHALAVFGEQVLLSIRYAAWSSPPDAAAAVAWARFWRKEVQGYTEAYRAVTGVDLASDGK